MGEETKQPEREFHVVPGVAFVPQIHAIVASVLPALIARDPNIDPRRICGKGDDEADAAISRVIASAYHIALRSMTERHRVSADILENFTTERVVQRAHAVGRLLVPGGGVS